MKAHELRGMSDEQLVLTLGETEKHLFHLRFQSATDRLETPSEIRKAKKDIARIKTEQRRRELAALGTAPDDQITKTLADLATKTEAPGKRRTKRAIARLTTLQAARAPKAAAKPAKGK